MSRIYFLLILCTVILFMISNFIEALTCIPEYPLQEKQKENKEEEEKKLAETVKIPEWINQVKLSFVYTEEKPALFKKQQPLSFTTPPFRLNFRGFNSFFGGPVNHSTGNPWMDLAMTPVYSLNRDPFTLKFKWD